MHAPNHFYAKQDLPRLLTRLLVCFSMIHILGAQTTPQTTSPTTPSLSILDPPATQAYTRPPQRTCPRRRRTWPCSRRRPFHVIGSRPIVNKPFPTAGLGRWLQEEYKEVAKTVSIVSIFGQADSHGPGCGAHRDSAHRDQLLGQHQRP